MRVGLGAWLPRADAYLGVIDAPQSLRLLRGRGAPVLGVWYDAFQDIARHPPSWLRPLARVIYDNVRACDRVLPVSAELTRMAREIRGGSDGNIDNLNLVGADPARFDPARADGAAVRARYGIAPDEIVVTLVGRIGGSATTGDAGNFTGRALVQAAPRVLQTDQGRRLRFLIVGFGPGLARFERQVAERGLGPRFIFSGAVPHSEVPDHLAAADIALDLLDDIFASRARNETKLKEYLAMGRAIIATGIGEVIDDLDQGRAGLLTRPDNSDLDARILELAADAGRRRELGARARARFLERYAWPVLAERFARVLADVCSHPRPKPLR